MKPLKIGKVPFVVIDWIDHHSSSRSWTSSEEFKESMYDEYICRTAGPLVGESKTHYIIALNVSSDSPDRKTAFTTGIDKASNFMYILKAAVIKKRQLYVKN